MKKEKFYKYWELQLKNAVVDQKMSYSENVYKLQISMGQTNVHPQNSNPAFEQAIKTCTSPITSYSDANCQQLDHHNPWKVQPIIIPHFITRQSPFKGFSDKEMNYSPQKLRGSIQFELLNSQFQKKQKENISVNSQLWLHVFYDSKLLCVIFDFSQCEDTFCLGMANQRLYAQLYLYRLFYRSSNWNYTKYYLDKKIHKLKKSEYQKILNQSYTQQSEHSLDLDRLESLFLPQEDISQQISRVDRIMRAINSIGIGYFQGLNNIIVVLVSFFNDETIFWLALLLIKKSQNLGNDPQVYQQFMAKLDKGVKQKCPKLYDKLQSLDFGVQYFGMKWVMGLFASDLCRVVLIHLWDLILNFGLESLKWFIVSIFINFENEIMNETDGDEINRILKCQLKNLITGQKGLEVVNLTKIMMGQQVYGQGCEQIYSTGRGCNEKIIQYLHNNFPKKQRSSNINIINIINQQQDEQEDDLKEGENSNRRAGYETFRTQYQDQQNERQLEPIEVAEKECGQDNFEQQMRQTTQNHQESVQRLEIAQTENQMRYGQIEIDKQELKRGEEISEQLQNI